MEGKGRDNCDVIGLQVGREKRIAVFCLGLAGDKKVGGVGEN